MEEHKQEMEDFLRFINSSLEVSETGVSDWIEMKSILELEEVGTDEQKEDILRRKIKVCQKIIGVFIGNQNSDKMIYVIEMGVVTSLLRFIDSQQLDKIQIYHIWAFFVFTCASNNQICLHLFNLNPFPTLVRLLDHSDSLVINKVVLSIFNIIIPGSNLTETASVHPYYESLEVVDGIQKLFDLYSRISNEEDKDAIVESIGNIYRAQEIPNDDMKKQIVSHLKQILMRVGDDQKAHAQIALSYLVQNSENLTEIKKGIDIDQIANNLKLNVDENQISFDCWIIIALLENRADDELRKRIIDSGYVRDLLIQFLTNDQESITLPHVHSFYVLTTPISEEVLQLLYSAKPYPALVKLLNHNDCQIVDYIVASIYSILTNTQGSLNSQELTQTVHPHFVDMQACGGVQKLFSLFQRNLNKYSRDHSAICVGALYGNKEITDRNIRREIISYLKLLQSDYHDQLKYIANSTLIDLGKNEEFQINNEFNLFLCGIDGMIMIQPMKAPNGKYYDYKNIQQYLSSHDNQDPDGNAIEITQLHFDNDLQEIIKKFVIDNPDHPLIRPGFHQEMKMINKQ
ncbi:MAG: hypothetical protein EZS28_012796 [Streblomastix strix]|uniref:RING-type E3 ubiquitin transferase n=1 Tax=Streblomastix strix TaxID=222440 RepID=A0A5J4WAJ5_9EUKA|nr:MAG: hypothetical protein EZS28_012796 [Streblomastix strix]